MRTPRIPVAVWALAGMAVALVAVPVAALAWRAPWRDVPGQLGDPAVRSALRLSLGCSLGATVIAVVVGVPLAWVLARADFPGRRVVRALALLPVVLPPVVGGVALLLAFGRHGLAGQWLDRWFGIRLPFSTAGAVLAETFVALPFLVIAAEAGFRSASGALEEAARTLGARPWTVLRRVTLPMVAPSIVAGAALCWARALGEFGATITFAGSFPGRTQTVPLKVYLLLDARPAAAVALSLVLLVVSLAVLVALRDRWITRA